MKINFDVIEGLSDKDIMELYETEINNESNNLSWCFCYTFYSNSSLRCKDIGNGYQNVQCVNGRPNSSTECDNFCTSLCGSGSYITWQSYRVNYNSCNPLR